MKKKESIVVKTAAVITAFAVVAFNYSGIMRNVRALPEAYYAESREELAEKIDATEFVSGLSVTASSVGDETLSQHRVDYKLFGLVTVKSVNAYVDERVKLTPCGNAVGITIYTDGVLVVGIGSFINMSGQKCSPADDSGIEPGDVILRVAGKEVSSSEELQIALDANPNGAALDIDRNGEIITLTVKPQSSKDGGVRIGAWVRDSTVGVGTLSFHDEKTGLIAALGHAVVDADTGRLIKVKDGKLVEADIIGVSRGQAGAPGELHGTFHENSTIIGSVDGNTELGIFGYVNGISVDYGESLQVAFPDEVHKGDAYVYTTVDGNSVERYSCRIVRTGDQDEPAPKGLVIEITDDRLIKKTGGIVQGMSGSPIVQDGKLVGVVTHVFVNDPQKGYGAYAYWMYETMGE